MKQIGIDLGGTSIKALLLEDGAAVREYGVPTPARAGRRSIRDALFSAVDALFCDGVELVGISSAGDIDPYRGVCVYATDNLVGWTGTNLRQELSERYHVRVQVDNDAVCALKGELRFYPGARDVTMLTFGTGVGGASLVGGKILRGRNFGAARWGHVILVPNGHKCNCGKRGCAEQYLSASALLKQGQKRILGLTDCKDLFARYRRGEKEAEDVLERFGDGLNVLLDTVRTVLSPEVIILGGGVAQSEDVFRALIKDMDGVSFARLGALAGAYGATEPIVWEAV